MALCGRFQARATLDHGGDASRPLLPGGSAIAEHLGRSDVRIGVGGLTVNVQARGPSTSLATGRQSRLPTLSECQNRAQKMSRNWFFSIAGSHADSVRDGYPHAGKLVQLRARDEGAPTASACSRHTAGADVGGAILLCRALSTWVRISMEAPSATAASRTFPAPALEAYLQHYSSNQP